MIERKIIPVIPWDDSAATACDNDEAFALMVLGDSMAPEFIEGDIVVIEPAGLATDGSFVLAQVGGEWTFRQLAGNGDGWLLRPLNPRYPVERIIDLSVVRGIVIQKCKPGRRKATKRYVE